MHHETTIFMRGIGRDGTTLAGRFRSSEEAVGFGPVLNLDIEASAVPGGSDDKHEITLYLNDPNLPQVLEVFEALAIKIRRYLYGTHADIWKEWNGV